MKIHKMFCCTVICTAICLCLQGCGREEETQTDVHVSGIYEQSELETFSADDAKEKTVEDQYQDSVYELIAQEDSADYLKKYGMQDCTPVCFTGDEGELRLELYVDRETGHGCGLKYGETKEGTVLAFEIDGYQNDYIYSFKNYPNPYSVDVTESYATLETHSIPNYL